jgi:DNA gyrase subunit A
MEVGLVQKIDIDREMQQAYLDYAMSVIVARALPDARDGLKPVHRRILYAMYDMGMRPDSPYKKSARIVGEVLGKYHPHGDEAVYEAMARMAQDFSMRYQLVDGQGNFGSVDGDPPAAMRYTEARLHHPAMHMLADITKDTVDFGANFDGTLTEPAVLPAALPNLLVNGATGIAVGMATSIPPHNLGEIVDAMQLMLARWEELDEIGIEDLMRFVQGPDFPTGGVIVHTSDDEGLVSAYSTGRGRVNIQARAHLEEMERGRSRIIVTELPYMTNKASLIERIAELVREEKLEGITDLRDESDRQGMRIVIELSKTAEPEVVLRNLYKHTPMQTTFSINMLALVDGEPRLLGLKQAMRVYLEHRQEIVRRRSQHDLEKARQRAHILEGLRAALKNLDEVIDIIRKAPDVETARVRLVKRFKLSEVQAQAILDMQLRRLAALERKKIEDEYKELLALIKDLEALLRSPKKIRQVVSDELGAVREAYSDRRRTHIVELKEGQTRASLLTAEELVPEKDTWLVVTAEGLISRSHEDEMPRLSGKEAPAWLARANTRNTLYLVGEGGEAAAVPVHAIPESDNPLDGAPLGKVSPLREGSRLAAVFSVPPRSGRAENAGRGENGDFGFVITVTAQGLIKKSSLSELPGPSANTFTLAKVNDGDRLGWALLSTGKNELLLATAQGMAIRFGEDEVRPMGLAAAGVMGIKLGVGDFVAGAALLPQLGEVFLVTDSGKAKRVPADHFPRQGRYGLGVQAWKLAPKESIVGLAVGKGTARAALHSNRLLPKAIRLDEAPLQTRAARGAPILELKPGDLVTRLVTAGDAAGVGKAATKSRPGGGESVAGPKAKAAPHSAPAAEARVKSKPAAKAAATTRREVSAAGKAAPAAQGGPTARAAPSTKMKPAAKAATTTMRDASAAEGGPTAKAAPNSAPAAEARAKSKPAAKAATTPRREASAAGKAAPAAEGGPTGKAAPSTKMKPAAKAATTTMRDASAAEGGPTARAAPSTKTKPAAKAATTPRRDASAAEDGPTGKAAPSTKMKPAAKAATTTMRDASAAEGGPTGKAAPNSAPAAEARAKSKPAAKAATTPRREVSAAGKAAPAAEGGPTAKATPSTKTKPAAKAATTTRREVSAAGKAAPAAEGGPTGKAAPSTKTMPAAKAGATTRREASAAGGGPTARAAPNTKTKTAAKAATTPRREVSAAGKAAPAAEGGPKAKAAPNSTPAAEARAKSKPAAKAATTPRRDASAAEDGPTGKAAPDTNTKTAAKTTTAKKTAPATQATQMTLPLAEEDAATGAAPNPKTQKTSS